MRKLRVMLTCCNIHVKDIIRCFKNNPEGREVEVFVTNSLEWELPPASECDGRFVVPRLDDPSFIPSMLKLCKEYSIDAIFPISSIDLDIMSEHRADFEAIGTKVSILPFETLSLANDKIRLHERFGELHMPDQIVPLDSQDVREFAKKHDNHICCKLADLCGGKGFAVVDDEKCDDVTLFHRFGQKHFISLDQLCRIVDKGGHEVILQEYKKGLDYTVSLLANNGKVERICGYVGYLLEFGSIMYGEIKPNEAAFEIARKLVAGLGLDGNIGIDYILHDDGTVTLLEINPRINASLPFVAEAGCNMMYLRLKQIMGESIEGLDETTKTGFKMKKYFATRYFE